MKQIIYRLLCFEQTRTHPTSIVIIKVDRPNLLKATNSDISSSTEKIVRFLSHKTFYTTTKISRLPSL